MTAPAPLPPVAASPAYAAHAAHASQLIGRAAHQLPDLLIGGASPLLAVWSHPPTDALVSGMEQHAVALHLAGCTLVERWCDGRLQGHLSRLGTITLVPAQQATRWHLGGHSRVAHLYVDPMALDAAAAEMGLPAVRLRPFFAEHDETLAGWMRSLLAAGDRLDSLACSEAQARVHRHLIVNYRDEAAPVQAPRSAAMTAATLRRLYAHVEERLDGELALRDLAAIARLSEDHFLRAFKASVGQTPHQYVLGRRLAQARLLLGGTRLALADVARRCGFASPSHFASVFRQREGVTPSDWRARRRAA